MRFTGKLSALCLLVTVIQVVGSAEVRYDNYRLYKVYPSTKSQNKLLLEMEANSDSLIFLQRKNHFATVVVAPHRYLDFEALLEQGGMKFSMDSENLQKLIEVEKNRIAEGRSVLFGWENYHQLEEINGWMQEQERLHPNVVSVRSMGKSYEKRDIWVMKISHGGAGKKAVMIEAGMHAREWIAPAVATFFINQLLNNNSTESQRMAQEYDWHIVVNANPDGYVYTQKDRLWRKTRRPYKSCFGADPNRNFNSSWNTVGVHPNPCSQIYPGPRVHSEKEVQAITNYISQVGNLRLYISLHSYSQLLLIPYGYTDKVPDHNEDLHEIADHAVAALKKRYGTPYKYGNINDAIYPVSGSSVDWTLDSTRTELAFCYELRPDGYEGNGFTLSPDEIVPTGEETTDSILEMVRSSVVLGYFD